MGKKAKQQMPIEVYKRLRLLYLIEQFTDACYGRVRLQKVTYYSERDQQLRVFSFHKDNLGHYCGDISATLEQLISMGLIIAEPLKEDGNIYRAARESGLCPHKQWLSLISQESKKAIEAAVRDHGYLKTQEILDESHSQPDYLSSNRGDTLLEANAPEFIEVDLPDNEYEELMLAMSPEFISTVRGISEAIREFDLNKISAH